MFAELPEKYPNTDGKHFTTVLVIATKKHRENVLTFLVLFVVNLSTVPLAVLHLIPAVVFNAEEFLKELPARKEPQVLENGFDLEEDFRSVRDAIMPSIPRFLLYTTKMGVPIIDQNLLKSSALTAMLLNIIFRPSLPFR